MSNTPLDPIALIQEAFEDQRQENQTLQESIAEIRAMMSYEDRGWLNIAGVAGGLHLDGLELDEVQGIAEKIAPKVAGGSLPKRAVDLHSAYVWGRGWFIEGTQRPKAGRPSALRTMYLKNQETLFSDSAREELQKERFITGNVLAAVNKTTSEVNRIPFSQVTGLKVDPDFPEKVIAYKRKWDTQDGTKESVKERWYYTARHTGSKQKSFKDGNKQVPVDQDIVIVDLRVNRQVGHVLGIPDGLAGLLWSETYGRVLSYGEQVQEGLAKIIFRVTNKSKIGAQQAGVRIGQYGGHGGTATLGDGQELTAVSTAGRGYDYATARPIAAMAAAAWNVSNIDLLNDSSAAGSSYGSAQALVGGNRNAMLIMQREWADFYKDIFETLGHGRPSIMFEPFEAPDKYRELQAIILGSVALSDEELRMAVLEALDIVGDASAIPDLLKARNVSSDTAAVQQASPDQGQSNGTGGGGRGSDDLQTSSEALRREIALDDIARRIEAAVARFEELSSAV